MNPQAHFSNNIDSVWRRQNGEENGHLSEYSETVSAPDSSVKSSPMSELDCSYSESEDSFPKCNLYEIIAPQAYTLPTPVWAIEARRKEAEREAEREANIQREVEKKEAERQRQEERQKDIERQREDTPERLPHDRRSDTEKWVMSSTPDADWVYSQFQLDESINNEVNCSWPPAPDSIWYDPLRHIEPQPTTSWAPIAVSTPWFLHRPPGATVNGEHSANHYNDY